jgi:hypothetical protein
LKGKVYSEQSIFAALCARSWSALTTSAKETVEDVSEPKAARATKWVLTAHVIVSASININQNFVSVSDQLESLLSFGLRVYIGVEFASELSIGLLDLILAGVSGKPEHLIVVCH